MAYLMIWQRKKGVYNHEDMETNSKNSVLSSSSLKLSLFPPWVLLQENVNFTEQPQLKITNFSKRNYEYPCKHLVKNLAFVLPSSLA